MAIISGTPTNGNDNIIADGANDFINALAGDDTVDGGAGNEERGTTSLLKERGMIISSDSTSPEFT